MPNLIFDYFQKNAIDPKPGIMGILEGFDVWSFTTKYSFLAYFNFRGSGEQIDNKQGTCTQNKTPQFW